VLSVRSSTVELTTVVDSVELFEHALTVADERRAANARRAAESVDDGAAYCALVPASLVDVYYGWYSPGQQASPF
jgi:uncharacterized membrane protein